MEAFTIGAHIKSTQDNNGNWYWKVIGFEESSFIDGEEFDILPSATSELGLIYNKDLDILE